MQIVPANVGQHMINPGEFGKESRESYMMKSMMHSSRGKNSTDFVETDTIIDEVDKL
jgi:hypothetical protein